MDTKDCCRCGEAPAVTEGRLCSKCSWAIQTEVAWGLAQLHDYLRHWDEFRQWEADKRRMRRAKTKAAA